MWRDSVIFVLVREFIHRMTGVTRTVFIATPRIGAKWQSAHTNTKDRNAWRGCSARGAECSQVRRAFTHSFIQFWLTGGAWLVSVSSDLVAVVIDSSVHGYYCGQCWDTCSANVKHRLARSFAHTLVPTNADY